MKPSEVIKMDDLIKAPEFNFLNQEEPKKQEEHKQETGQQQKVDKDPKWNGLLVEIFETGLRTLGATIMPFNTGSVVCTHPTRVTFSMDHDSEPVWESLNSADVIFKRGFIGNIFFTLGHCPSCGRIYYGRRS
jgi:hypothetical protein